MIKTISILGAGALGGAYAGKFFDMDSSCVSLVASGERYERLKDQGLIINNTHYTLPLITPEDTSPPTDLIIMAVKQHHLQDAIHAIGNQVGPRTIMLSIMNGLDSEEHLAAMYGKEKVLYTISIGIDAVREGNRISYSQPGKLLFGEAENKSITERVRRVQELFERAGIMYETPADMIRTLWWKFMVNVGINQTSAVLHAPYDVFQKSKDAQVLMESAMREVILIAKAAQVNLGEKDLADWYSILSGLAPQGKTSMLQDIEAGRKTEVEMFAGKLLELGYRYNIPTPVNQTFLRIIKVIEEYAMLDSKVPL